MKSMLRGVICVGIVLSSTVAGYGDTTFFTFADLGSLPGGNYSVAQGINDRGTVVGSSEGTNYYGNVVEQPAIWNNGRIATVDYYTGFTQQIAAINNSGNYVVDYAPSGSFDNSHIAFPALNLKFMLHWNSRSYVGTDINDSNQTVAYDPNLGTATLFQHTGDPGNVDSWTVTDLPFEGVQGINTAGRIVGNQWVDLWDDNDNLVYLGMHGYIYDNGALTDLGHLHNTGGIQEASTRPLDINNTDMVVGESSTASGDSHAFGWESATGITDLGTLGGSESSAEAVNDAGLVVGWSDTAGGGRNAFAYTDPTGMVDLNMLMPGDSEWTLTAAHDVNTYGQIVGEAMNGSGDVHGFLLSPAVRLTGAVANGFFDPVGFDPGLYGEAGLPEGFTPLGGIVKLDNLVLVQTTAQLAVLYTDNLLDSLGIDEQEVRLFWFDETTQEWVLAGAGSNLAPGGQFVLGEPTNNLGDWGVDPENNLVWANIDHASSYGLFAVPEPASLTLLAIGGAMLLLRRRRL